MRNLALLFLLVLGLPSNAIASFGTTAGTIHCASVERPVDDPEMTATVNVRVENEFTYFAPGNPLVAGAYVMVYDPVTLVVLADGVTGPSGIITFTGIPAGALRCAASALSHESAATPLFTVTAGGSITQTLFLRRAPNALDEGYNMDADGDGYFAALNGSDASYDCDDTEPAVHPGALEICGDGIDNDCDGVADEVHTSYADLDGDGFGDAASDSISCSVPAGFVTNSGDLCPNDPLKSAPGSCGCGNVDHADFEPCSDGNACNGLEYWFNCVCVAGTPLSCDDGNPCTLDACDPQFGCQHVPLPDGTVCGVNAQCVFGACITIVDTDGDGVPDASDNCPTVPGQVGAACDDGDPDTFLSVLNGGCLCEAVPQAGDYRSVASGAWESASTWEVYSGGQFLPASSQPNAAAGWITVRTGHSVSISSSVATDQTLVQAGATLTLSSTLSLNDGTGDDLRIRGTLTLAGGVLSGSGSTVIRNGGVLAIANSGIVQVAATLNIEQGGTLQKTGNSGFAIGGTINNAGTFNMNGGLIAQISGGPRIFNNLSGGVINLNTWRLENLSWNNINLFNAGTINKNSGNLVQFDFAGDRWRNLDGGVVNVNSGTLKITAFGLSPELTDQRGSFNIAAGATLTMGSNFEFRFLGTTITNNGTLNGSAAVFLGPGAQSLNGNGVVRELIVNGPSGVTLGGTQTVQTNLSLQQGKLTLNNGDLVLGGASISNASDQSYIVTSGTGALRRSVAVGSTVMFHVGTATSYLPTSTLLDGGSTADDLRVRVSEGVNSTYDSNDAPTGTAITSAALQRTWIVRELVNGGSNLTLALQWNPNDEAPGFTRNTCRIARNDGNGWDTVSDAAATGTGPFTRQRNGITDLGVFTVLGGLMDLCPNGPEPGTPCDDGSACTINDLIGVDCQCSGTPTNCDDGNPCTLDLCDPQLGCQHVPVPDGTACGATAQCIAGACTTIVLDTDGDGTIDANDCAPTDPAVHPGAIELCNGTDDDCDGQVDEGAGTTWYADSDADGFGVAETTLVACAQPNGFVAASGDCNDNNAAINPMAYDACPDGIDNNCNGLIDEQSVLIGDVCSSSIGSCQPGVWGCVNNVLTCVGGVLPGPELCSDGLDNDCDGQVDEQGPDTQPLTWFVDADGDGHGDPAPTLIVLSCDLQPGYALVGDDCDDGDPTIHPGATEVCNGVDEDCDGQVDEGTVLTWYFDEDGDGFGDDDNTQLSCTQPNGYVAQPGDCDDLIPTTYPGAPETCNGADDDCDGLVDGDDPSAVLTVWYLDNDGDGYGITGITASACDPPPGYASQPGDCNDNDASVHPNAPDVCVNGIDNNCNGAIDEGSSMLGQPCSAGACVPASWDCVGGLLTCVTGTGPAVEICGDGVDNDCDGAIDEEDPNSFPQTWYLDGDNDGYGDPGQSIQSCFPVAGHVIAGGDCNDANPAIHPGVMDICDGIDNNCDGLVDVGIGSTWYLDGDGDGFAAGAISIIACAPPVGYTSALGDCDDNNASIHPTAYDACPDGIDNNCNGLVDEQAAMIGQPCGSNLGACQPGIWTCLSNELTCVGGIPPGLEICSDGVDNDCDGDVDEITPETVPLTWYIDVDGDGFGNPDTALAVHSCDPQPGYAVSPGDCNDNVAAVNPVATEACNGIDDDCDGQVDEGCACSPADIALMLANTTPTLECVQGCYGGQPNNLVPCVTNCYVQAGYSQTCATCVVQYLVCTSISCPECDQDPNSPACIQCHQSAGCDAAFMACSGLEDADGDGDFSLFDCDDNNASVSHYGIEGCAMDGLDNDCDGQVDEDALTDADGDGYTVCTGDCLDLNADVNPAALEVCDGVDNNCNGTVDEGFPVHYLDNDGDGYGDPNVLGACGAVGSVPNNLDCDDTDPTIFTGAPELCDGLDNDCNGNVDDNLFEDQDNDGFMPCTGDCDDANTTIYPGAPELCDGLDNDCSGAIEPQLYADNDQDGYGDAGSPVPCGTPGSTNQLDCDDNDPLVTLPPLWFPDEDGDGYGVYGVVVSTCTQPVGYAGNSFDCNDNDPQVFPGQGCVECSPADLALMASDPGVINPAQPCLISCGSAQDPQQCFSDCLADNGLSGACADCFAAYAYCLTASCPICQEQPESPACLACQGNSGCNEAFMACSGLEDADDDGYFAPYDCNDLNAAVHPDAQELCDALDNDCDGTVDEGCDVRIAVKMILEGPYDPSTGLMNDGLRAMGLVPTTEPYSGLGYVHVGGGSETSAPAVLSTAGVDAIVDWVLLELRDADDPTIVLASRSALLQRDGDVVEVNGTGPVTMPIGAGTYHVAVRHRNHLGCMTSAPLALSPGGSSVDFSMIGTSTYGTNARKSFTGSFPVQALWAGDVTFDGSIRYTGADNDRDPILQRIGGSVPTNTSNGYEPEDVDLNGTVKYTGSDNDRDPILQNIGGTVPTNTREAQLP